MNFTGERYIPSEQGEIRVEHYHRYALAMSVAGGKSVLDVACGEGYGAALLSQVASRVVGMDISESAIAQARSTYANHSNLHFECYSVTNTGLPDGSIDLVVSFETIEHLAEQEEMLAEIRRVLKPSGLLLISSPNRPVYSEARDFRNEFHVKELDFKEFDALLKPHFSQVDYYGQRLAMGTVIQPLSIRMPSYKAFSDDGNVFRECTFDLDAPMYYLALCGPGDGCLPSLDASIFIPDSLDLVKHYEGFARWAKNQDNEITIRDHNVLHYKSEAEKFENIIQDLQRQLLEVSDTPGNGVSSDLVDSLVELRCLLDSALSQRDRTIVSLRDELTRAEAQLDLLKDLMLGGREEDRL